MAEPVVYGAAYSTYVRTVRMALTEKGVAYRLEPVDIMSGETRMPEHLARHPFGKIPAFEHDGFSIFESVAITCYVDEAFPGPRLQPAEQRDHARMLQAISIVDNYAYPALVGTLVIQRLVMPLMGVAADEEAIQAALPGAALSLSTLDALIGERPYLAGDSLSLADLTLIPVFDYARQIPEGATLIAAAPNLQRWWASLENRPSVVETRPSLG